MTVATRKAQDTCGMRITIRKIPYLVRPLFEVGHRHRHFRITKTVGDRAEYEVWEDGLVADCTCRNSQVTRTDCKHIRVLRRFGMIT